MPFPLVPLLGLAAEFVPGLISAVAGDRAGKVAGQIAGAAKAVFGTDDEDKIRAAIAADPNLALQFQMRLVEVELEFRRIEKEELQAVLLDIANARAQTVELARAGSWLAFMPAAISFALLALAAYVIRMVFNGDYAPEQRDLVNIIVGGVAIGGIVQVANYWLGSTGANRAKDQSLAAALSAKR